jgi:hypothetical protein
VDSRSVVARIDRPAQYEEPTMISRPLGDTPKAVASVPVGATPVGATPVVAEPDDDDDDEGDDDGE